MTAWSYYLLTIFSSTGELKQRSGWKFKILRTLKDQSLNVNEIRGKKFNNLKEIKMPYLHTVLRELKYSCMWHNSRTGIENSVFLPSQLEKKPQTNKPQAKQLDIEGLMIQRAITLFLIQLSSEIIHVMLLSFEKKYFQTENWTMVLVSHVTRLET